MTNFNPNEHRTECEAYLSRSLKNHVRFVQAEPLTKSTRDAPWRLDVQIDGTARSYVLRVGSRNSEHEYQVLRAMESVLVPTPRVYGWDPEGKTLGAPCFLSDFIAGESLLTYMLAGEPWAEALYIDTACALQAVTWEQVATVANRFGSGETAENFLDTAYDYFETSPHPLADAVYAKLKETMPALPEVRFSNGDLYPDNLIVRDEQLVGVIDFEHSGFSDPIYEFLLPFFVCPELRGRGIEESYCQRMEFDPETIPWYRALEHFDILHWVLRTGKPFVHYTADNLGAALEHWLGEQAP